ncbi:phage terminase large subunit family protein, partial [Escherichia coli]
MIISVTWNGSVRALPVTPVEWADQNYYLPKESSYGEGEWKTLPFQIAIMNSMGNDQIRTVNLIKSARVGYTKMLLGGGGYFIEHKSRNSLLFQSTDSAAEDFMKSHVEATIRNVPCLKDLSPWLGRKHRDNTLTLKRFSSGVGFWCLGGAAAKNYREKSVDVVCYDELSSFEPDVEKEGSPTLLGDKRIEGSVWPKSIRGSTPKIKGTCQIEKAANESAHFGVQSLVQTTSKGDRNPSSVRILIQLQRNGRWVTEKDVTINGKTTSQFLASVILDNLPPRPFNIRMVRETADSTTDQLQNRTLWSSYTEIIDVKQ